MRASQKQYNFPRLYLIADAAYLSPVAQTQIIRSLIESGVGIVQFRDKTSSFGDKLRRAEKLQTLCAGLKVPLLINDDVGIAHTIGAAGVHLGRQDMSINRARTILGEDAIIGASCYNSLDYAQQACRDGADYVAFGAIYNSPTKPDAALITLNTLRYYTEQIAKPVCAIGGISAQHATAVFDCGVAMIAAAAGILAHANPASAVRQYLS